MYCNTWILLSHFSDLIRLSPNLRPTYYVIYDNTLIFPVDRSSFVKICVCFIYVFIISCLFYLSIQFCNIFYIYISISSYVILLLYILFLLLLFFRYFKYSVLIKSRKQSFSKSFVSGIYSFL